MTERAQGPGEEIDSFTVATSSKEAPRVDTSHQTCS